MPGHGRHHRRSVIAQLLREAAARVGKYGAQVHEQGDRAAGGDDRNGQPAEGVPDKDKGTVDLAQRAGDDLGVIAGTVRPVAWQVDGNGPETATAQLGDERIPAGTAVSRSVDQTERDIVRHEHSFPPRAHVRKWCAGDEQGLGAGADRPMAGWCGQN